MTYKAEHFYGDKTIADDPKASPGLQDLAGKIGAALQNQATVQTELLAAARMVLEFDPLLTRHIRQYEWGAKALDALGAAVAKMEAA